MPALNPIKEKNFPVGRAAVDSCLITKLAYYIDISDDDRALIAPLEKSERPTSGGKEIFAGGDEINELFVVKYGWFVAYTLLPDGGRLLVRVYHAGDVIGFPAIAFRHHTISLRAATDGCLCPFPKCELDKIFTESPRIAALLFTLAAREEAILVDTLRAASRMRPQARIAYLLLTIHARLRITNTQMGDRFRLPLTQKDIGDAIGLTNVTVSRTMKIMEERAVIERNKGDILLTDLAGLKQECDFEDRHEQMDISWFPAH